MTETKTGETANETAKKRAKKAVDKTPFTLPEKVDVRALWRARDVPYVGKPWGSTIPVRGKPPSLRKTRKTVTFSHPIREQEEAAAAAEKKKAEKAAKKVSKKATKKVAEKVAENATEKKPATRTSRKKHPSPETLEEQQKKAEKQERLAAESLAQNALHAETQERLEALYEKEDPKEDAKDAPEEAQEGTQEGAQADAKAESPESDTEVAPSEEGSPLTPEEEAIRAEQEKAIARWVSEPLKEEGAEYEKVATKETLEGRGVTASDAPTTEQLKDGIFEEIVRRPIAKVFELEDINPLEVFTVLGGITDRESLISEKAKARNARHAGDGLLALEENPRVIPDPEYTYDDDDDDEDEYENDDIYLPETPFRPIELRTGAELLPIHYDEALGRWVRNDNGVALTIEEFNALLSCAIEAGWQPNGESEIERILRRESTISALLPESEAYTDYVRAMLYWEVQTLLEKEVADSEVTPEERAALPLGLTTEERARYHEMNPSISTEHPMTLGGLAIPPQVLSAEMAKFDAQEKAKEEKSAPRALTLREKLGVFWQHALGPALSYTFSSTSRMLMVVWGLLVLLLALLVLYRYWASLIVDDRDPALLALLDDSEHEKVAVYEKARLKERFVWASVGEFYGLKVPRAHLRVNPQWTLENTPPVKELALGTQRARYAITPERLNAWLTKCVDAESRALGRHLLDVASPLIGEREKVNVTHRVLWRCGLEKVDPARIQSALFDETLRLKVGSTLADFTLSETGAQIEEREGPAVANVAGAASAWERVEAHVKSGTPMPVPEKWALGINGLEKPIVKDPIFHPLGEPYRSGRAALGTDWFPRAETPEEAQELFTERLTEKP